ncbi:MAG TPA: hypothetical protein VFA95_12130 [Gammaproteobacteria bacterium]|nr:hypothetical protein [Gammaproteobacteria bacterium]
MHSTRARRELARGRQGATLSRGSRAAPVTGGGRIHPAAGDFSAAEPLARSLGHLDLMLGIAAGP